MPLLIRQLLGGPAPLEKPMLVITSPLASRGPPSEPAHLVFLSPDTGRSPPHCATSGGAPRRGRWWWSGWRGWPPPPGSSPSSAGTTSSSRDSGRTRSVKVDTQYLETFYSEQEEWISLEFIFNQIYKIFDRRTEWHDDIKLCRRLTV